ncbi:glycosyltransferase family 2 protein [Actinomyces minihominis]|uniref:glycosyltransferase family 2 protein n=1 Tax=Actinomyces minihominis TaxID=2002838 RepID=UPI000C0801A0|nr:glycosyltransferase family 2 protein [Actinomyces minihominis]
MKTEGGQASNKSGSHGKYPRLLVIIPAWNEAETIGAVLDELRTEVPEADVLVVSDGSTDQTVAVAESRGVAVLELPLNLGVGAAMRTGYLYAHRNDYDWAVQLDADGQHDPKDIPLLLQEAQDEDADLVIGARFAGKGDYAAKGPRKWAMSVMSKVLSPVVRTKLTDTTSGFKLNSRKAIALFSRDYPAEYLGDTVGALTIGARQGLRIRQVPVEMRQRAGGDPSHGALKSTRFLLRAWFALAIALTESPHREKGGHHSESD